MGFRDLIGYQKATLVFDLTKKFAKCGQFELVDQMKRSSRGVCSNIAEAYGKRHYPKHFIAKISDSEMENYEDAAWYDIAFNCKFITEGNYKTLVELNEEIGRLLNFMRRNPGKFKCKS